MKVSFKIQVEQSDRALVLAVNGDVDLSTSGFLDDALTRAKSRYAARIVVDLGGVDFIDSSGLRVLVKHTCLEPGDRPVRLTNCSAQARRLFEVSGVMGNLALAAAD